MTLAIMTPIATQPLPVSANLMLLTRIDGLLSRTSTRQYTHQASAVTSTVGKHIRHLLEHYESFLRDLDNGDISYDRRERNKQLERNRLLARQKVKTISMQLGNLSAAPDAELQLRMLADPAQPAVTLRSSVPRELLYLQSHTLHHLAVIQLLLASQGVKLPTDFAAAPATLEYERSPAPGGSET